MPTPRFRHGLVIGKFAPLHRGHQHVIETALAECAHVSLWAYSHPDFPEMPTAVRQNWLRTLYPDATILPDAPNPPTNDAPDSIHQAYVQATLASLNVHPDAVYTSEPYGDALAEALGATHRSVDPERTLHRISGAALREDVHAHRDWMDPRVYAHFVKRIALVGAESTGKSTLSARLAEHYGTVWIEEYGRFVFEREGRELTAMHHLEIAHGHIALEDMALREGRAQRFLISDTHPLTTLWWSYLLTRSAEPELVRLADACRTRYAHTFVCGDDVGFTQDGWRSNTSVRSVFQSFILYDLDRRSIPYTLLTGSVEERLARAVEVLEAL